MRVGIATDHGGFSLKVELVMRLRDAGHDVIDFGAAQLSEVETFLSAEFSQAERHLRRLGKVALLEAAKATGC